MIPLRAAVLFKLLLVESSGPTKTVVFSEPPKWEATAPSQLSDGSSR